MQKERWNALVKFWVYKKYTVSIYLVKEILFHEVLVNQKLTLFEDMAKSIYK